jgi:hypothetical protein
LLVQAFAEWSTTSPREKTVLELQIESAREIHAALNRPENPIEPLPPITAKLARSPSAPLVVAETEKKKKKKTRLLSTAARNAFASTDWSAASTTFPSPALDRHAIR